MALILMVDDEPDACRLMERILSAMGHRVQAFTDTHRAMEWLQRHIPELTILDIKMHGTNDIQVLETIRQNYPETKVVMITGHPSADSASRAQELGVREYLVKPLEIDELERSINRVLGLNS